jgi:NitT/TauT family transport system permease protein
VAHRDWLGLKGELPDRLRLALVILSFVVPLIVWCLVSYLPFLWHSLTRVTDPGSVEYFVEGMEVPNAEFAKQLAAVAAEEGDLPKGVRVNPVYLPAPHEVLRAFFTAFTTPPRLPNEPWLHESLGHSIRTIFFGFLICSLLGVPLGILCGTYRFFAHLQEPFIEFFRYLPAPAFGALCVAILGIDDGPKIAIIVIGTFFQQVLVIANTVRKVDPALVEAAQTLGARGLRLVRRVIIPASITDIYTDMRILLGWAWTYLIVAEVVGTMSGITFFINQQARYRNFDNVYAAIMMIGIIGLTTDMVLAWFGKVLFPWKRSGRVRKPASLPSSAGQDVAVAGQDVAVAGSPQQSPQSSLLSNFDKLEPPVAREAGATPLQS